MTEHQWLTLLSALCTITIGCLGIVIKMLGSLKSEFFEEINEIRKELQGAVDRINETAKEVNRQSMNEHREIWERLLHHSHNEQGQVVIPAK